MNLSISCLPISGFTLKACQSLKCYFVEFWLKGKLLRNEREDSSLQEMLLAGGINMDTSRPLYQ